MKKNYLNTPFTPPLIQFNGHLQTIIPSVFRKIQVNYKRDRIELPDGDFLDLDWVKKGNKKLIIVTHGLEGDSSRHYVTGMVHLFAENDFDALGWNCRSCSGEINRVPRFYHHGDAGDLKFVLEYVISLGYEEVYLSGFSMGGSLTLRLLGEYGSSVPSQVKGASVASVPLDLPSSVRELYKRGKRFYMNRFIKKLAKKIELKSRMFPDHPHLKFDNYWQEIKNFDDFDNRYTAPLHGYKNANDFYYQASAKPLLGEIKVPTLLVQAQNDPFLSAPCFDLGNAVSNKNLKLLMPVYGGHVGFQERGEKLSFMEKKTLEFFRQKAEI